MTKLTIERTSREENGRTWHHWKCSCGESSKYLNRNAMVSGSQSHADKHRKEAARD